MAAAPDSLLLGDKRDLNFARLDEIDLGATSRAMEEAPRSRNTVVDQDHAPREKDELDARQANSGEASTPPSTKAMIPTSTAARTRTTTPSFVIELRRSALHCLTLHAEEESVEHEQQHQMGPS